MDVWKSSVGALRSFVVLVRIILLFLCITAAARAEISALAALRLIPSEAAKRLVAIEAREGNPSPERWYFLVNDPGEQRGLREFVVAEGKLVTSRVLSQFADSLKPADVIGADAVKVDSTQVAKLAGVFAEANDVKVGTLNYTLARDAAAGSPVWRVTVLDSSGDQIGLLMVNAVKGAVLRSDGFEKTPAGELLPPTATAPAASSERKTPRKPKATPTPKPSLLKRFFGGSDKKKQD